jgi:predicted small lipoprotein YifL
MNTTARVTSGTLAIAALVFALAACGNKGPLVRAPDEPPPVPVEETLPDLTPPGEDVPATDVVAPADPATDAPADAGIPPPPPAEGDGG